MECAKDAEAEEENTALERRPPLPLGFAVSAGSGLVHGKTDTGGNETDLVIPGGAAACTSG
jgi:hypothetical protein